MAVGGKNERRRAVDKKKKRKREREEEVREKTAQCRATCGRTFGAE